MCLGWLFPTENCRGLPATRNKTAGERNTLATGMYKYVQIRGISKCLHKVISQILGNFKMSLYLYIWVSLHCPVICGYVHFRAYPRHPTHFQFTTKQVFYVFFYKKHGFRMYGVNLVVNRHSTWTIRLSVTHRCIEWTHGTLLPVGVVSGSWILAAINDRRMCVREQ